MKKMTMSLTIFLYILFSITATVSLVADAPEMEAVYFYDRFCSDCQEITRLGILDDLEADGVSVTHYDILVCPNDQIFIGYIDTYEAPPSAEIPIIFAGSDFYYGVDEIKAAYEDGSLLASAQNPLLDIGDAQPREISFIYGLLLMIGAGLLDGINPCAIAMLLLFISLVGFTKDRKVLLTVSISYIGAIFLTYFAIGVGVLTILNISQAAIVGLSYFLYAGFALLFFLLFLLTFYDFYVTRKQKYGLVKNQLPKFVQKFNKNIMEKLTRAIHDEKGGFKQKLLIVIIPFFIGIIVGITEAACTGQVYFAVLASINTLNPCSGISTLELFYIFVFNLMFIVPLIIIAFISVKSRSIMGVSNFIRKRLSLIKLVTSIFFLLMVFYFVYLFLELIRFFD